MNKKKVLFIVIFGAIGLLFLEGVARIVYWMRGPDPAVQMQLETSSFRDKPWARDFFEDQEKLHEATKRFAPYVAWEGREFDGTVLHVEPGGIRRTWNPPSFESGAPKEIFVFGGSTVWGTGVRDEGTLPSQLSKLLNRQSAKYRVTNFGQEGYSSTQELIKLMLLLKEERRPDFVIFYDGYNNVLASFLARRAGSILGEAEIRERLETPSVFGLGFAALKLAAKKYSMSARAIRDIARGISPMFLRGARLDEGLAPQELDELARAVAADYLSTLDILDLLAARYGFRYAAYWQPSMFHETELVGDEKKLAALDPTLGSESLLSFFASTRRYLEATPPRESPTFLTDALKGRSEQLYIDSVHLSEEGNERMAQAILDSAALSDWQKQN